MSHITRGIETINQKIVRREGVCSQTPPFAAALLFFLVVVVVLLAVMLRREARFVGEEPVEPVMEGGGVADSSVARDALVRERVLFDGDAEEVGDGCWSGGGNAAG